MSEAIEGRIDRARESARHMVLGMTCGVHYNAPLGVGARARFKELVGPGHLAGEVRQVRVDEECER